MLHTLNEIPEEIQALSGGRRNLLKINVLAVPTSSEYAGKEAVSLKEIAGKSVIFLAGTKGLRSICNRFCLHAGFKPNVTFESDNVSAVKNLIGAGILNIWWDFLRN